MTPPSFFEQYGKMLCSEKRLEDAWHTFQRILPDFTSKDILIWVVVWLALPLYNRTVSKICYRN